MARIRTVKPELWTDERLTECSPVARLLFIGMFNFADDRGNLSRSAKRLKMQVLPADSVDCEILISELIENGLVVEYEVNGVKYLKIKGFAKHQVINRPTASSIPDMEAQGNSLSTHGALMEHSVSNHGALTEGMEGKGRDIKEAKASSSGSANRTPSAPPCPVDRVVDSYEKLLPSMPRVRRSLFSGGSSGKALRERWRWVMTACHERGDRVGQRLATTVDEGVEWFDRYFVYVADSDFLTAKMAACDLKWLVGRENFEKVLSGRYHSNAEGAAS